MNQLTIANADDYADEPIFEVEERAEWQLQKLKPVHRQICALLAQGMKNVEVAKMTGVTKEYITMLLRQPLIKQEIARMGEITGARLELLFEKTVDTIADAMDNGSYGDKLKAARLQLEATRRIGRPDPFALGQNVPDDRLEKLANRLEHLLDTKKGGLYDERGNPIEEAEVVRERSFSGSASAAPQDSYEQT